MEDRMARTALVTGGATGIGATTATMLKKHGYRVVVNNFGKSEAADAFRRDSGIPVHDWNVADFDACQEGVAMIVREVGPIEVLVNNAGITRDALLHKMSPEQWRAVIEVDLDGCFNMCRAVIESMRQRRFGRIVNVSSVNGLSGQAGQTNYSAAKAGVIGFTKALALEAISYGITVNAIAPGYTDTALVAAVKPEMVEKILKTVPAGRLAQPEELARGILFLVSDESSFITGATLSINGGKYMA
jgi:acetoacetyl-CoA reductase